MRYNNLSDLPEKYQKQAEAKIEDLKRAKKQLKAKRLEADKNRSADNSEGQSRMPKGKNKYGNHKVEIEGMKFDSQKEACRWLELKILQDSGLISGLKTQVPFELIPAQKDENGKLIEHSASYVADFVYCDSLTGCWVVEDVKGYKKGAAYNIFALKRKMMLHKYGIRVKEI